MTALKVSFVFCGLYVDFSLISMRFVQVLNFVVPLDAEEQEYSLRMGLRSRDSQSFNCFLYAFNAFASAAAAGLCLWKVGALNEVSLGYFSLSLSLPLSSSLQDYSPQLRCDEDNRHVNGPRCDSDDNASAEVLVRIPRQCDWRIRRNCSIACGEFFYCCGVKKRLQIIAILILLNIY